MKKQKVRCLAKARVQNRMNRPAKLDAMTRGYEKILDLVERGISLNS